MPTPTLLQDLLLLTADRSPDSTALTFGETHLAYAAAADRVSRLARGLHTLGLESGDRVAIFLEKRLETAIAAFGAAAAGGVFVPVNPLARAHQLRHILLDCSARFLVTSRTRLAELEGAVPDLPALEHVLLVHESGALASGPAGTGPTLHSFEAVQGMDAGVPVRNVETAPAAIFYTSGSTGAPKGVVASHRNLVAGAESVASYLEHTPEDALLAVLPLSFDAGFSQFTTGFIRGARVVLHDHLLPLDILNMARAERITGITAVPPLWIRLARMKWPAEVRRTLRYLASTGGHMPADTVRRLREALPETSVFLMYGLTEGFRAAYLPPEELDRRPGSMGRAIPNVELFVAREDGSPCEPGETGELVQRGPLVTLGYWNDPEGTRARFRPLPEALRGGSARALPPETVVFSGDLVRMDGDGYLYFEGRRDEMIKTSGYRVSPTEVEEVIRATGMVSECLAFGRPHEVLGHEIAVIVRASGGGPLDLDRLLQSCRGSLPSYMVPRKVFTREEPFPVGANGKVDRARLIADHASPVPHADQESPT